MRCSRICFYQRRCISHLDTQVSAFMKSYVAFSSYLLVSLCPAPSTLRPLVLCCTVLVFYFFVPCHLLSTFLVITVGLLCFLFAREIESPFVLIYDRVRHASVSVGLFISFAFLHPFLFFHVLGFPISRLSIE